MKINIVKLKHFEKEYKENLKMKRKHKNTNAVASRIVDSVSNYRVIKVNFQNRTYTTPV